MNEFTQDPEVTARVRQSIAEGEQAMASGEPMTTIEDVLVAAIPGEDE